MVATLPAKILSLSLGHTQQAIMDSSLPFNVGDKVASLAGEVTYTITKIGPYVPRGEKSKCKGKLAIWFKSPKAKKHKIIIWESVLIARELLKRAGKSGNAHVFDMYLAFYHYYGTNNSFPNSYDNQQLILKLVYLMP